MSEAEALHAATAALSRLDERLRGDPLAPTLATWFLTQEALGVAASEGLMVREVDLLRILDGADEPMNSRAHRTALDVHAALALSVGWPADGIGAGSLSEAFRASDRSNPRRTGDGAEGRLEIDASILAERVAQVSTHDPWTAAEVVRHAWAGGGFGGRSRRVALLIAPAALAQGFGCQHARCCPLAASLSRDAALRAVDDPEAWPEQFFSAVAAGARRAYGALSTMTREVEASLAAAGRLRSSARNGAAATAFMGRPVRSTVGLAESIGVSPFGASKILGRLVLQGVVAPATEGVAKGRQFVWRKAVGL